MLYAFFFFFGEFLNNVDENTYIEVNLIERLSLEIEVHF